MLHRKVTTFPKVRTVDSINLQPGELIHVDFALSTLTSVHGFTFMLTIVYANNIMPYVFHTPTKRSPIRIIRFVLTT